MKNITLKIAVLITALITVSGLRAQSFEMEGLDLLGYESKALTGSSGGSVISLTNSFGYAQKTVSTEIGAKDLTITYVHEGAGNTVFDIYVAGKMVDSWFAHDYFDILSQESYSLVSHTTRNVTLLEGDLIEIVAHKSENESAMVDKLEITSTEDLPTSFNLSAEGVVETMLLDDQEYTSSASSVTLNIFSGSKLNGVALDGGTKRGDVVSLKDGIENDNPDYIFRTEEFDHHVRLKLIALNRVPKKDNSFSIKFELPYSSSLKYVILDDEENPAIEVIDDSGVLTIYWTKLAERGLTPGGYIAFYPEGNEEVALEEINGEEIVTSCVGDINMRSEVAGNGIGTNTTVELIEGDSISLKPVVTLNGVKGTGGNGTWTWSGPNDFSQSGRTVAFNPIEASEFGIYTAYYQLEACQFSQDIELVESVISSIDNEYDLSSQASIFPNPFSNVITIQLNTERSSKVEILNALGQVVVSQHANNDEMTFDLNHVNPGMYIVKITSDNQVITREIIKE